MTGKITALRAGAVLLTAAAGVLAALADGGKIIPVLMQMDWQQIVIAVSTLLGIGAQLFPQLGQKEVAEAKAEAKVRASLLVPAPTEPLLPPPAA